MKHFLSFLIALLLITGLSYGQAKQSEIKFSSVQLKDDLAFLQHLIKDVHVNPNWELSNKQFQQLFDQIYSKLKDSITGTDFLKLIKPVIAHLSDEHSQIYLKPNLLSVTFQHNAIYPPFTLSKNQGQYFIRDILQEGVPLKKGDQIFTLNNIPIEKCVKLCALDTIGFPDEGKLSL